MNRRKIQLGAELGKGGEGTIYAVPSSSKLVAKMWAEPDEAKARKLNALLASKPNIPRHLANRIKLAWPNTPLLGRGGRMVGFYMPRAWRDQYREFVAYSIPSARGRLEKELGVSIGERELLSIARNVAEAFEIGPRERLPDRRRQPYQLPRQPRHECLPDRRGLDAGDGQGYGRVVQVRGRNTRLYTAQTDRQSE